ncbi:MAG: hypothetical protein IKO85_05970 [Bacteroidaceae bacterium]|nr:hypothetical protein [Bacteroidaceae bacterium]
MKKKYMTPALDVQYVQEETMIAASITGIGGDTDIELGVGDAPEEADVKENFYGESIFD